MSALLDENGFCSPLAWTRGQLDEGARRINVTGCMDIGIVRTVQILMDADIETYESCQGGERHAYAEPTIRFNGTPACGWRALAILMSYDLPVGQLSRTWVLNYGVPDGPCWEVTLPGHWIYPSLVQSAQRGRPAVPGRRFPGSILRPVGQSS
jgi:hypothetical protein